MRIMSPSTRSGNEEMSVKSESLKSLNRETNISTNECKLELFKSLHQMFYTNKQNSCIAHNLMCVLRFSMHK